MVRTLAARSALGALAGLMTAAGLMVPVQAGPVAPLGKAGALVGWGIGIAPPAAYDVPRSLQDTAVSKVIAGAGFSVALTATGEVVVLGRGYAPDVSMEQIPASLADERAVDIAAGGFFAAAVTSAGKVVVWGSQSELPDATDVPTELAAVKTVTVGQNTAAAVKVDGTVVAWGGGRFGETDVPAGLTGVASIAAGDTHYYALKTDGTVVAWGSNNQGETTLPAALTVPGNVKAIAARSAGGLALLADGSLVSWGLSAAIPNLLNGVPDSLNGKKVVAISALSNNNMALEEDGTITVWGLGIDLGAALGMGQLKEIPSELEGADITGIAMGDEHALALVTEILEVGVPTIAGSPRSGKTLTGTPAVFSGAPTVVANQWFADETPIASATGTSLLLTEAHVGKRISFASTATSEGDDAVVSSSEQTAAIEPEFAPSTVSVSAAARAFGDAGKVTVSVANALHRPANGTLQLHGAGAAQTVTVSGGTATFDLDKGLAAGGYTLMVEYSGTFEVATSSGAAGLTVRKGKSRAPTFKVNRVPTSTGKGRAFVGAVSNAGLPKVSGKTTVTLKRGKTTKKISVTLSGGKRSIVLPKLRKGAWRVQVFYRGDRNYSAQKSKWYILTVKK